MQLLFKNVTILLAGMLIGLFWVEAGAGEDVTMLSLLADPILHKTLYEHPQRMVKLSDINPSGAISVNADWEAGQSDKWYIELQRYAADLVEAGVATNNKELIETALKVLDWGFQKQAEDGGFPGTGDAFHSVSMFVEGGARALLLLQQQGSPDYTAVIKADSAKLHKAAQWLTRPDVEGPGRKGDSPFTHRCYILAAALGEAAQLTHDQNLAASAQQYAELGISRQTPEGINPEKKGYDVSYQMVGIMQAEHYYTTLASGQNADALREKLRQMITLGLKWEEARMKDNGDIEVGKSTRIGPGSAGRSGKQKGINYKEVSQAFIYWYEISGNKEAYEAAERIARFKKWVR